MPISIERLIASYTVLVLANMSDSSRGMDIESVPESKIVGGVTYPIRAEVEISVALKTIEVLG